MKINSLLSKTLTIIFIFFVVVFLFVYITENRRSEFVKFWYFQNNFKRVNLAVLLYAEEHDGIMPPASSWADLIKGNNQLILKGDFVTPMSYSGFGIYYNNALENESLSRLNEDTVVLFTAEVPFAAEHQWNANGSKEFFYKHGSKHSYLITLNGEIYKE